MGVSWGFEREFRQTVERLTRGKSPEELEEAADELESAGALLSELADDLRMRAADMEQQEDDDPEPDDEDDDSDPHDEY